jgi:dolichol-phosphate mannosyltransferase
MAVGVVVPTYNEVDNIGPLVQGIRAAIPEAHIVFVDDGSPDGTAARAIALDTAQSPITVLEGSKKAGLGLAYRRGFAKALSLGLDPICQMDADLSHDPACLPRLIEAGGELVLGSRYVAGGGTRHWPWTRQLISRAGTFYARIWLGLPMHDMTGGFKCWSSRALSAIDLESVRSEGYVFQVETTWRAACLGLEITEVPIVFTERVAGESKMNPRIAVEAAWRVPLLRLRGRFQGSTA